MRLVKFSARNFRSITDTHVIELGSWTVLVGPNNEGKSNLLRALAVALSNLKTLRTRFRLGSSVEDRRGAWGSSIGYSWTEDFPIGLQESKPDGESVFRLWFSLSESEKREFADLLGTRLRTDLSIEIRLGRQSRSFRVRMPGPAASPLTGRRDDIAAFLEDRLDFDLIRAVRTASDASNLVKRTLTRELAVIEDDPAYTAAMDAIDALQKPIFERVGQEIERTLKEFLPEINAVTILPSRGRRSFELRSAFEVIVDDGTATPLKSKGDGVQSIAALSLRRAATTTRAGTRDVLLLIEEPESHLHPGAARKLRSILEDIAETTQIVMTTHNAVFVDRRRAANNVIVEGNRARVAQSIDEIRDQLGIHASDNLRHAELVLVVEGDSDRIGLRSLLNHASAPLSEALATGRLTIEAAGGSDRVSYQSALIKNALCDVHVFLDYDAAGRSAAAVAQARGILHPDEVSFASCRGNREAELEDLYAVEIYAPLILATYGVALPSRAFNRSRAKWTSRVEAAFAEQGRDWALAAKTAKGEVAGAVAADPTVALNAAMREPFDALVASLERRLLQT